MSAKRQIRIYIEVDDEETFDVLKNGSPLSDTQLASVLMSAALKAIKQNGGKASLPLRFQIEADQPNDAVKQPHPKRKAA